MGEFAHLVVRGFRVLERLVDQRGRILSDTARARGVRASASRSCARGSPAPRRAGHARRRRSSSAAATIRAREAARSDRAWTLEIAVATNSVKSAIRDSASSGIGSARDVPAAIAPQRRPLTTIGLPTAESALATPRRVRPPRARDRRPEPAAQFETPSRRRCPDPAAGDCRPETRRQARRRRRWSRIRPRRSGGSPRPPPPGAAPLPRRPSPRPPRRKFPARPSSRPAVGPPAPRRVARARGSRPHGAPTPTHASRCRPIAAWPR